MEHPAPGRRRFRPRCRRPAPRPRRPPLAGGPRRARRRRGRRSGCRPGRRWPPTRRTHRAPRPCRPARSWPCRRGTGGCRHPSVPTGRRREPAPHRSGRRPRPPGRRCRRGGRRRRRRPDPRAPGWSRAGPLAGPLRPHPSSPRGGSDSRPDRCPGPNPAGRTGPRRRLPGATSRPTAPTTTSANPSPCTSPMASVIPSWSPARAVPGDHRRVGTELGAAFPAQAAGGCRWRLGPGGSGPQPVSLLTGKPTSGVSSPGMPTARSSIRSPLASPAARATPRRSPASASPATGPTPLVAEVSSRPAVLSPVRDPLNTVTAPATATPVTSSPGAPTARSSKPSPSKSPVARDAPNWSPLSLRTPASCRPRG